jgi:hypothetical protein
VACLICTRTANDTSLGELQLILGKTLWTARHEFLKVDRQRCAIHSIINLVKYPQYLHGHLSPSEDALFDLQK